MADAGYLSAVKATFETKPLRTVLMIDDEFPTFSDIANKTEGSADKKFRDTDRAVKLYDAFRKCDMICDIENVADEFHPNRIRKSDLIILDYHLGPVEGDSEKSISILRELAGSKHFNTVVVYTAEPDLNKVWLEIMASLGGGWTTLPAELSGESQGHWERLSDEKKLPSAPVNAVMEFARKRSVRNLSSGVRKGLQDELVALGVPPKNCTDLIDALVHVEMAARAGRYATQPARRAVGDYADNKRWIQSGNAFITILKKNDLTNDERDPAGIMACLSDALIGWRPNLIQILVSEMQNILELEALITDDEHLREPVTHAALWFYLLDALGTIDPSANPDVRVALTALIDRIIEGVRRRLSTDPDLLKLASDALLGEIRDAGWNKAEWPGAKISSATEISRTKDLASGSDIMFRLNSFLSTEVFRRAHISTGTVVYHKRTDQYFVVASPACDLALHMPSKDQQWTRSIHPLAPVVAILLHTDNKHDAALAEAAKGQHIFLENENGKKVFKVVAPTSQPSYEIFFLPDGGIVREVEGRKIFDAGRLGPKLVPSENGEPEKPSETERDWVYDEFEVVGQLRPLNANRILQSAGQHLSRIGLDFIDMPTK
jgi:hypothetical protein